MTVQPYQLKASCYVAKQVEVTQAKGITLEFLDDFDELRKVVDETGGRAPLTPIFDNTVSQVSSENGFWILGRDEQGAVVHLQAVRCDEMGGGALSDFFAQNGDQFMSPHIGGNPADSDYAACRYVREMRGRICYHGEVWLNPVGDFRGKGLSIPLPRIGVAHALMRWAPDYIYGLVHPDLVMKGIPARFGYTHFHPHGIRWRLPDGDGYLSEYITWMSRDDMCDLVETT